MKFEDLKIGGVYSSHNNAYPRWTITEINNDNRWLKFNYVYSREAPEVTSNTVWIDAYEAWTLLNKVYRNYPKEKL